MFKKWLLVILLFVTTLCVNVCAENQCIQGARGVKIRSIVNSNVAMLSANTLKQYSVQAHSDGNDCNDSLTIPRVHVICYKPGGDQRCNVSLYGEQSLRCVFGDRLVVSVDSTAGISADIYELSTPLPICSNTVDSIFSSVSPSNALTECAQIIPGKEGIILSLIPDDIDIPPSGSDLNAYCQCGTDDKIILQKNQKIACCEGVSMTIALNGSQWDLNDYGNLQGTIKQLKNVLLSIQIIPATSAPILSGNTEQFTAIGTYSDNSTKDITNLVNWKSDNTAVATINTMGLVTALTTGATNITAELSEIISAKYQLISINPPIANNISKLIELNKSLKLNQTDFTITSGNLDKIKILSLPTLGILQLAGITITNEKLPLEIKVVDLNNLIFIPNLEGNDKFTWLASDGVLYSINPANFNILITKPSNVRAKAIAGGVIGGVAGIAAFATGGMYWYKKSKSIVLRNNMIELI